MTAFENRRDEAGDLGVGPGRARNGAGLSTKTHLPLELVGRAVPPEAIELLFQNLEWPLYTTLENFVFDPLLRGEEIDWRGIEVAYASSFSFDIGVSRKCSITSGRCVWSPSVFTVEDQRDDIFVPTLRILPSQNRPGRFDLRFAFDEFLHDVDWAISERIAEAFDIQHLVRQVESTPAEALSPLGGKCTRVRLAESLELVVAQKAGMQSHSLEETSAHQLWVPHSLQCASPGGQQLNEILNVFKAGLPAQLMHSGLIRVLESFACQGRDLKPDRLQRVCAQFPFNFQIRFDRGIPLGETGTEAEQEVFPEFGDGDHIESGDFSPDYQEGSDAEAEMIPFGSSAILNGFPIGSLLSGLALRSDVVIDGDQITAGEKHYDESVFRSGALQLLLDHSGRLPVPRRYESCWDAVEKTGGILGVPLDRTTVNNICNHALEQVPELTELHYCKDSIVLRTVEE